MEELIEEVLTLARQGQPINETETIDLSAVAARCWQMVETASAEPATEDDLTFIADGEFCAGRFNHLPTPGSHC